MVHTTSQDPSLHRENTSARLVPRRKERKEKERRKEEPPGAPKSSSLIEFRTGHLTPCHVCSFSFLSSRQVAIGLSGIEKLYILDAVVSHHFL